MTFAETEIRPVPSTAARRRVRTDTLVLLGSAGVLLALGAGLTVLARGQELLPGELEVARQLGTIDNSFILAISGFFDIISNFDVAPLIFVGLLPVVWLAWGRTALVLFTASGSLTALTAAADLADRVRPTLEFKFEVNALEPGIYPSGHVVYGVLVFGMVAYLAYKHMRPGIGRASVIVFMAMLVLLMGPSRVIELDHWPADSVGSYLLSIPFLLVLIWIDRHPVTQPGGRVHRLATSVRAAEDAVKRRLIPGRH